MTIDWSKPIQTYDGKKARVLCTDLADSEYPVVVAVSVGGIEIPDKCTHNGIFPPGSLLRKDPIENVPKKKITRWAHVDGAGAVTSLTSVYWPVVQ